MAAGARVEIHYCRRCRFLHRAAWVAQELLLTFPEELGAVALVPGDGGVFRVCVGGEPVFCRKQEGRFPELAELKRLVRDRVAPGRELGHSEGAARSSGRSP